jgi:hypothetical protein
LLRNKITAHLFANQLPCVFIYDRGFKKVATGLPERDNTGNHLFDSPVVWRCRPCGSCLGGCILCGFVSFTPPRVSGGSGMAGAVLVVRLPLERTTRRPLAQLVLTPYSVVWASGRHAQKKTVLVYIKHLPSGTSHGVISQRANTAARSRTARVSVPRFFCQSGACRQVERVKVKTLHGAGLEVWWPAKGNRFKAQPTNSTTIYYLCVP